MYTLHETGLCLLNGCHMLKIIYPELGSVCIEKCLLELNENDRKIMCKFRTANINLLIESGRWLGILRNERKCDLCKSDIGDEFHYLFKCKHESVMFLRNRFIPKYCYTYPSQEEMEGMFNIVNAKTYIKNDNISGGQQPI